MGHALILLIVALTLSIGAAHADTAPRRVMFDQHFSWLTPAGADQTLRRIKDAGFNVFVPCVWIGRGTTWPSALAPATPEWTAVRNRAPDPLAYLIERAHALGIEVHPWFTVSYRTREFLPQFYDAAQPGDAFDIHRSSFREFFTSLVVEVATRYAVDGINLDYVRAHQLCVSASCRADYRARFDRDLQQDRSSVDARPNALGRYPPAWESIAAWNREALSDLVRSVAVGVRRARPGALLSVDTIAEIREFQLQGADAVTWANAGWVDVIYHMNYGQELDAGPIDAARRKLTDPAKLVVLLSTADWPGHRQGSAGAFSRDPQLLVQQATQARTRWSQRDLALWTYRYLTDAQIADLLLAPSKL